MKREKRREKRKGKNPPKGGFSAWRYFIDKLIRAVEKDADFDFAVLVGVQRYDRDRKGEKLESP